MQIPQHADPIKNHLSNVSSSTHIVLANLYWGGTLLWHWPINEAKWIMLAVAWGEARGDLHDNRQGEKRDKGQRRQDARRVRWWHQWHWWLVNCGSGMAMTSCESSQQFTLSYAGPGLDSTHFWAQCQSQTYMLQGGPKVCKCEEGLPLLHRNKFDKWGMQVEPPTRTISSMLALLIFESGRTCSMGSKVLQNGSWQSSSKHTWVREV